MDRERLIKILNLTQSSFDGEALSSIRIANSLLKKDGITWDKFIAGVCNHASEISQLKSKIRDLEEELSSTRKNPFHDSPYSSNTKKASIREMLDLCLDGVSGPSLNFIESLDKFFKFNGYLTIRQIEALKKFYGNLC